MCYRLELVYHLLNNGTFLLHGLKPFIAKLDDVFMKRGKSTGIMENVCVDVDRQLQNASYCSILDSLQLELMAMHCINMGNCRAFKDWVDYCLVQL